MILLTFSTLVTKEMVNLIVKKTNIRLEMIINTCADKICDNLRCVATWPHDRFAAIWKLLQLFTHNCLKHAFSSCEFL